jgi:hypothetical protein
MTHVIHLLVRLNIQSDVLFLRIYDTIWQHSSLGDIKTTPDDVITMWITASWEPGWPSNSHDMRSRTHAHTHTQVGVCCTVHLKNFPQLQARIAIPLAKNQTRVIQIRSRSDVRCPFIHSDSKSGSVQYFLASLLSGIKKLWMGVWQTPYHCKWNSSER